MEEPADTSAPFPQAAQDALRGHALDCIRAAVEGWAPPGPPADYPAELRVRSGVFVTIRVAGALRGCIGCVQESGPVIEAAGRLAVEAATADLRFAPVEERDLPRLELEFSVLGEPREVAGIAAVEPGRHGVIVSLEAQRGLLLPQVATREGWDAQTFVAAAAHKAGIPLKRLDEARIEVFEAEHF